jgi:putative salt-induced outer membrane protein YdiY
VVSLSGGTLTFKTDHGELQVPWAIVSALRTDAPLVVTTATAEPRLVAIDSFAAGPALTDIVALQNPPPPLAWSGGAGAGILTTGGNTDISSVRLDGELVARTPRDRYTTSMVLNRAEDAGRQTASNWTTAFAYDRFLTERLFAQASTILTNDRFRDLDLRTALGAGLGYQVWNLPAATLSVNAGLGYVHENFESAEDDSYTALREAAKLDLFFVARRIAAFHHHDGYFGVTGDDNLFFRMQNGVRLALVAGFVTTAQVDVDYDRSPAPGRETTERSFSLTLGYRF